LFWWQVLVAVLDVDSCGAWLLAEQNFQHAGGVACCSLNRDCRVHTPNMVRVATRAAAQNIVSGLFSFEGSVLPEPVQSDCIF
jgi:hypothetical protein